MTSAHVQWEGRCGGIRGAAHFGDDASLLHLSQSAWTPNMNQRLDLFVPLHPLPTEAGPSSHPLSQTHCKRDSNFGYSFFFVVCCFFVVLCSANYLFSLFILFILLKNNNKSIPTQSPKTPLGPQQITQGSVSSWLASNSSVCVSYHSSSWSTATMWHLFAASHHRDAAKWDVESKVGIGREEGSEDLHKLKKGETKEKRRKK